MLVMVVFFIAFRWIHLSTPLIRLFLLVLILLLMPTLRSEERFSRNAETDPVGRLLLEKQKHHIQCCSPARTQWLLWQAIRHTATHAGYVLNQPGASTGD